MEPKTQSLQEKRKMKVLKPITGASKQSNENTQDALKLAAETAKKKNQQEEEQKQQQQQYQKKISDLKLQDLKKCADSFLGKGAFAYVEKYFHQPSNQYIALKILNMKGDKEQFNALQTELETLIRCNHPSIIQCYGVFFQSGTIQFALEFMDCGSLTQIIKFYGPLPEIILGIISKQVLLALEFLHKTLKVIHRDIKPSNMLINSEGEIKIADFGVSAQLENSLEQRSTWVGTTMYMSPERLKGENYTTDSDLWSLGLTLIEAATGKEPFYDSVSNKQLKFWDWHEIIINKPAPKIPETYSQEMQSFVDICLQKQSGNRSSATELLQHKFIKKYAKIDQKKFKAWLSAYHNKQ